MIVTSPGQAMRGALAAARSAAAEAERRVKVYDTWLKEHPHPQHHQRADVLRRRAEADAAAHAALVRVIKHRRACAEAGELAE